MKGIVDLLRRTHASHSRALVFSLWICWLGIAFALSAGIYLWVTQGQVAWVMFVASFVAFEISMRIFFRRGLLGMVPAS